MILSDQNFAKILAPRLEKVFNARMDWLEEWLSILRLPLAKKLVGCRGPDFGYFRYRDVQSPQISYTHRQEKSEQRRHHLGLGH
jgi:hypothetical protein